MFHIHVHTNGLNVLTFRLCMGIKETRRIEYVRCGSSTMRIFAMILKTLFSSRHGYMRNSNLRLDAKERQL